MTHPTIPPYLHTLSVPTPFPVGPVNVYLAEGDQLTLVDAGPRYDPVDYFLAISEVVGHLQWLEVEGWVTHDEHGVVACWRRAS